MIFVSHIVYLLMPLVGRCQGLISTLVLLQWNY